MNFKSLLSLTLLAAAIMPMYAKHITADEALERVTAQIVAHRVNPLRHMELKRAVLAPDSQTQIAYIFSRPSGQGFMILSADDNAVPVLAYSDENSIDTENLPPAMIWWLQGYAAQCSDTVPILSMPKSRDYRAEITPLISTKWNQNTPFNDQCPLIDGKRAVTGCVATAMAQIMNYHKWPVQGTGSREYEFVSNGKTYTDAFDFGATTFDWENMVDNYNTSTTVKQRQAVATLMHACGVASLMKYGVSQSSATGVSAAMGMILNLGYDKSMSYHERAWYGYDDWCTLIYNQLAEGRPVLFGGQSQTGAGHQFICDGYGADNYFHFNWGWGGLSDGYYYMYDLHPDKQGVGSNGSDYDYDQTVLIDIKPAVEGSDYTPILFVGDFYANNSSSKRSQFSLFTVVGPFYAMTFTNIDVKLGLRLENSSGNVQYVSNDLVYSYSMPVNDTYNYYPYFQLKSMDIPVGKWVASPVFKTESDEWMPMYCDRSNCTGKMYLNVTNDLIETNLNSNNLKAEFVGMSVAFSGEPLSDAQKISAGETYDIEYKVVSDGEWHGDVRCVLANSEGKRLDNGAPINFDFTRASSVTATFQLPISPGRTTGDYYLVLVADLGDGAKELARQKVTVEGAPGSVTGIKYLGSPSQIYYVNHTYTFDFDITVDAKWSDEIYCAIVKDGYIQAKSADQQVLISEAGTEMVSFKVTLDPTIYVGGLPAGSYSLMVVKGMSPFPYNLGSITISPVDVPVEATAIYNSWTPANGLDSGIFPGHEYNFVYDVTTDGIWHGEIYCVISDGVYTAKSDTYEYYTPEGTTTPFVMTIGLGENFALGEYELTLVAVQNGEEVVINSSVVNVVDVDGISSVVVDAADEVRYYNLQGVPVEHPVAGDMLIKVQGNKVSKVIVK